METPSECQKRTNEQGEWIALGASLFTVFLCVFMVCGREMGAVKWIGP